MILSENDLVRWGNRIGREVLGPLFLGLRGPPGRRESRSLPGLSPEGPGWRGPFRHPPSIFSFGIRLPGDSPSFIWISTGSRH